MNTRIDRIRENEKRSHTKVYTDEVLYNTDSWLKKPIKTVQELMPLLSDYDCLRVLDIGCGIGRNSIYIAENYRNKCCMAHLQYLVFNNENIPMPASYSVSLSDVEADSGGVTEAGTTQRDVVREGVVQIGVTFRVSKRWLNKFSAYKKLASITVGYLDMETMNIVDTQMYIDGYQVKLVSDTSYGSLWEVSFTLKEF